jgi:outer membrane protein assembly factor BamA
MSKIKFKNMFLILILGISSILVYGQTPIVRSIDFVGYEKTNRYILEREIQHQIDVPLDTLIAEADRLRLENLGIFSVVNMQYLHINSDEIYILYTVIENWRFFPAISPIYDEKWGWSVKAMLMISNFRGRNESLAIRVQYGGQNAFGVEYYNPWITGDHVSIRIGIGNDVYDHTFLPYDVTNNRFQLGFGKYLNNQIRTNAGLFINKLSYSNNVRQRDFINVTPYSNIIYDSRDLYTNPSTGVYSSNSIYARIDSKGDANNLLIWNHSTSNFQELIRKERNTVLGINIASRITFGNNLDIWYDYVGGAFSVRGWKVPNQELYKSAEQSYRFGMNWVTSSVEIRQTIIPKFATKMGNELGLSIVTFTDVGVIDNDISNLFRNTPMVGVGVGIRIPWSVVSSIRLDYGWSFYKGKYVERALHLAFGEKF